MRMTFSVNTSPFAGLEGKFVTSRNLKVRARAACLPASSPPSPPPPPPRVPPPPPPPPPPRRSAWSASSSATWP